MKVFGIGLSKTGTTSLDRSLNILGVRSVHYPYDKSTVESLTSGRYELSILDDVDAVTDITTVPFYRHLDTTYPGSKFILTVRNKGAWLESTDTFWNTILINGRWNTLVSDYLESGFPTTMNEDTRRYLKFTLFLHAAVYGSYRYSRDRFSQAYDDHVSAVTSYFSGRSDLLVMDILSGDGWEKLCPFLGRDIPEVDFPHENRRKTYARTF